MLRPITETLPLAPLKIIALDSHRALGEKVDRLIADERRKVAHATALLSSGYKADTYLVDCCCPRFGSGEAKGMIQESVRGADLFILADVMNSALHFKMQGEDCIKSPDDNFQDLKRIISSCSGKPHRINIILPFFYEGRQHKKNDRESLDCALALCELSKMGVANIITFDSHDPRVQNAIPIQGSDNFFTSYQFIQALFEAEPDIPLDSRHFMIVTPDEGGINRAMYYSTVLGVNLGMFYKRRDCSASVHRKKPIVTREYLGNEVCGKIVLLVDDIISSGESILEAAAELKKRGAAKIFLAATFGLFTNGLARFDELYEKKIFDRVFITNLAYSPMLSAGRPYSCCVDLSKYLALIIDTLNNDISVNEILNPLEKIHDLLAASEKPLENR